jgi:predicted outer membrane protein
MPQSGETNHNHFTNTLMNLFEENTPRRTFLATSVKGTLALGVGMSGLASLLSSFTYKDAEEAAWQNPGQITSEAQFRAAMAGPAQVSMMSSQMAVAQATNKNAKEFANFEFEETKTMMSIMKDMGTTPPAPDAKAQAMMNTLKTAKGAAFDKAYIKAQVDTHEQLRTLTEGYLRSPMPAAQNAMEKHGRHIAALSLVAIKEHLTLTRRILTELG